MRKRIYLTIGVFAFFFGGQLVSCVAQGTWTPKTPLPALGRCTAVAFAIGTKGYLGTGYGFGGYCDDFWEYDPITNSWTQKANFGGGPRAGAVGFSIGNYGYIGSGSSSPAIDYNDFWRYNPTLNSWTQLPNFGGSPRHYAVGFSVAGKGYIGTGGDGTGTTPAIILQDLWEYDPVSNSWAPKANYMGGDRSDIDRAVFVICNKAYMGTGMDGTFNHRNDFWEYDLLANTWTQKTNFPGIPRAGATGFSIGGRGFLGIGYGNVTIADFWKYNPFTNSWSTVTIFPGGEKLDAPVFVINSKAYIGTGMGTATGYHTDLWEFTPDSVISITVTAAILSNPNTNTICIGQAVTLSASGGSSYSWSNASTNNTIIISPTATTTYSVIANDMCGSDTATVTIYIINAVTAVITCKDVCAGSNATLIASGGATYLWSNGAITNSITVSPAVNTTYSVTVTNTCGSDMAYCTVNVFPSPVVTTNGITDVSCNGGSDGTAAVVAAGGTPSYTYLWSPTGGINPVAIGLSAGTYIATVTDANGCTDTQIVTVASTADAEELYLPNAFSPNNDGENDKFCLQGGMDYCIRELKIIIYDRWGEKTYESSDKDFCWDGYYNNKLQNAAVFVYYLEATFVSGQEITKKGNISLIR